MGDRDFIFGTMTSTPGLVEVVGDRIYQGESLDSPPVTKPFIVYRIGNTSRDDMVTVARKQYFTVYVHDEANPGDYQRIDDLVDELVDAFHQKQGEPGSNIVESHWLETSADFDDREMGTILRYVRFQIIKSKLTT